MSTDRRTTLQREATDLALYARRLHAVADAEDPAEEDTSAIKREADVWQGRAGRVQRWASTSAG
jgi:hypothetical protein